MKQKKNLSLLLILNFVSLFTQFFVYRIIIKKLGTEQMGIWSILSASTTLGLISNFGFSSGLIKYTAQSLAKNDKATVNVLAGTANVTNLFFSAPLVVIFYYLSIFFATKILTINQLITFKILLPYCLFSLYLNNISSSFISILDGYNYFVKRCIIQIIGFVVYGLIAVIFISKLNLFAVSIAVCFQSLVVLITSMIWLFKSGITFSLIPLKFDYDIFKKLFGYGLKFQFINILVFLFDPIIKYFITKNFGLVNTANYEISTKLVVQLRTIVINLLQVVTPKVASIKQKNEIENYIELKVQHNTFLSINVSIIFLFGLPTASYFFIGNFSTPFISCCILLMMGWLSTMIIAPIYFACLGLGKLRILIIQHFIISIITISLFTILDSHSNTNISFLIPTIALFVGSTYLAFIFSKYYNVGIIKSMKNCYYFFVLFIISAVLLVITSLTSSISITIIAQSVIFVIWCLLLRYSMFIKTIYLTNVSPILSSYFPRFNKKK